SVLFDKAGELVDIDAVLGVDEIADALANLRIVSLVKRQSSFAREQHRSFCEYRQVVCFIRKRCDQNILWLAGEVFVQSGIRSGLITRIDYRPRCKRKRD